MKQPLHLVLVVLVALAGCRSSAIDRPEQPATTTARPGPSTTTDRPPVPPAVLIPPALCRQTPTGPVCDPPEVAGDPTTTGPTAMTTASAKRNAKARREPA